MSDAAPGGYAPIPGGRLFYEVRGEGTPVVLLHAALCDRRMWDDSFDRFAARFRTVRYDARGFGRSSRVEGDYSDAEDLAALLDHLGLPRAALVGTGYGARIALDLAALAPERVDRQVLVSPTVSGYQLLDENEEQLWEVADEVGRQISDAVRTGDAERAADLLLNLWAPMLPADRRARLRPSVLENLSMNVGENERQRSPDPPAWHRLAEIPVPTMYLVGDRDHPGARVIAERCDAKMPHSRLRTLEGADQLAPLTVPASFEGEVFRFLAEPDPP